VEWDVRGVSPEVVAALLGVVGGADREDRRSFGRLSCVASGWAAKFKGRDEHSGTSTTG